MSMNLRLADGRDVFDGLRQTPTDVTDAVLAQPRSARPVAYAKWLLDKRAHGELDAEDYEDLRRDLNYLAVWLAFHPCAQWSAG